MKILEFIYWIYKIYKYYLYDNYFLNCLRLKNEEIKSNEDQS